jgi:hypothetical protein
MLRVAQDGYGSFATEMGIPRHVCFPPDSDRIADMAGGPFRADFVAKVGCGRWVVGHLVRTVDLIRRP